MPIPNIRAKSLQQVLSFVFSLFSVYTETHTYFAYLSHFKGCLRYVLQHLKICGAAHLWTQGFTHKPGMDCSGDPKVSNSNIRVLVGEGPKVWFPFTDHSCLCTT